MIGRHREQGDGSDWSVREGDEDAVVSVDGYICRRVGEDEGRDEFA